MGAKFAFIHLSLELICSSLPHFDRSSYEGPSYEEGFEEIIKVNFVPKFKDDCIRELYMQFLYWLLLEWNEVMISTKKSHYVRSSGFRIEESGILSFGIHNPAQGFRNPVIDWNPEFTGSGIDSVKFRIQGCLRLPCIGWKTKLCGYSV